MLYPSELSSEAEWLLLDVTFFFKQMWISYWSTLSSGTAMGMILGFITVWVAFTLLIHWFAARRRSARNRKRARAMPQMERDEYYDEIITDGITDAIEEHVAAGKLSREEATTLYSDLALKLKTTRLLPQQYKGPMTLYLMERAKHIMRNRMRALNSFRAPKIPGDPPPVIERKQVEEPTPVRSKRKPRNKLEAAMMPAGE